MDITQLKTLAQVRAVVGYLGERDQYAWWQSGFFSPTRNAFLSPIFPRTQILGQYTGVVRAAALVHDERIGVGNVYHLFRLPEDMEQGVHRALHASDLAQTITVLVATKETALAYLRKEAGPGSKSDVGPTRIGDA